MSNSKGLERLQVVLAGEPADVDGTSGLTGDYFDLSAYERVMCVCAFGDGTAASDLDMLVYQASDNGGTGAKVLNALQTGRIYTMYSTTYALYAALTGWTKVTQATADEQYTPTDNGEAVGVMVLELKADDLDNANSFTHIRCDLSDPGAAKIAALLYIGLDPKTATLPELMDTGF